MWVLRRSSRGRPENVLGTSWINLPRTSLERQIRVSLGHHFMTSPGCQIKMSPGWSNRIFRGRPQDVLGTNIWRLGCFILFYLFCNLKKLQKFAVVLFWIFSISSLTSLFKGSFGNKSWVDFNLLLEFKDCKTLTVFSFKV